MPRIHGRNGVGDLELPAVDTAIVPLNAAELLVETARRNPGSLSVIATGPLTNLARWRSSRGYPNWSGRSLAADIVERLRAQG